MGIPFREIQIGEILQFGQVIVIPMLCHQPFFPRVEFHLARYISFTLPKTNSSPLKIVLSKFGISKLPGGPPYPGWVELGGVNGFLIFQVPVKSGR